MNRRPLTVTINLAFILVNAVIWLILGIIIALDIHPAPAESPAMKTGMAIISIIISALLLVFTFFLYRHNRMVYYYSLAFFIFTSILTVFDDFGVADLAFLIISIVPIILLLKDRRWYIQDRQKSLETT